MTLHGLETLWVNTGTLCNLSCTGCYIESSPRNDSLAFLTRADLRAYLDEIARDRLPTRLVGFTGGEPFINPDLPAMLDDVLSAPTPGALVPPVPSTTTPTPAASIPDALTPGVSVPHLPGPHAPLRALVLTNAMRPMRRHEAALLSLHARHPGRLTLRVSLDHYAAPVHDRERGPGSWAITVDGLQWLARAGLTVHVASRMLSGETEPELRAGYAALFASLSLPIDAGDPVALTLFPEMDAAGDVPEITAACWGLLGRSPDSVMCASSRMVVRRRGSLAPAVVACTLLPHDPRFELGATLARAAGTVALAHPHCARFCVLGGASCAGGGADLRS